jgi:hypothetical protein
VEVPVPLDVSTTLFGLRVGAGPEGEIDADRNIVFEKPLMLRRPIVAVPVCPTGIVREAGLALMLKSTTLTVITTE